MMRSMESDNCDICKRPFLESNKRSVYEFNLGDLIVKGFCETCEQSIVVKMKRELQRVVSTLEREAFERRSKTVNPKQQ